MALGVLLDYDRGVFERAPAFLVAVSMIACGCGYTSAYVPPDGWRARPLYTGNEVAMIGSRELPQCAAPDGSAGERQGKPLPVMMIDGRGDWVASPHAHVVFWGPVFVPHPFVFVPPGPHSLLLGSLLGSGHGGGGGGDGKAAAMVMAFMAAAAVVASSGVAIGLAAASPEDSEEVVKGIDSVNQHNDRVRERISECMRLAEATRAAQGSAGPQVVPDSAPAIPTVPSNQEGSSASRPSGPGGISSTSTSDSDSGSDSASDSASTSDGTTQSPSGGGTVEVGASLRPSPPGTPTLQPTAPAEQLPADPDAVGRDPAAPIEPDDSAEDFVEDFATGDEVLR